MHIIDTTDYRDYTIQLRVDEDPPNPWEEWDCEPPIAVLSFGYHRSHITTYGDQDVIREVLAHWSPEKLWANRKQVIDIIGASRDEAARTLWDYREPGNPSYTMDLFGEFVDETLTDSYLSKSDLLEAVAALYRLAGIPAGVKASCGHSQGHYAEVLVVLTPEWCKRVGYPVNDDPDEPTIKAAVNLWGNWAWGNVYGYTVIDPDGEDTGMSCWGYYGDPDDFMISEAKSEIDAAADERLALMALAQEGARPDLYSGV